MCWSVCVCTCACALGSNLRASGDTIAFKSIMEWLKDVAQLRKSQYSFHSDRNLKFELLLQFTGNSCFIAGLLITFPCCLLWFWLSICYMRGQKNSAYSLTNGDRREVRCASELPAITEPFYYQLMHIMLKNTELLKHSKINKNAPTCFGLHRNHLQGAKVSAWLKVTHLVNSICVKDVQGVVSAMAAYCDL